MLALYNQTYMLNDAAIQKYIQMSNITIRTEHYIIAKNSFTINWDLG